MNVEPAGKIIQPSFLQLTGFCGLLSLQKQLMGACLCANQHRCLFLVQALESALPESVSVLVEMIETHAEKGADKGQAVIQLLHTAATCAVRPTPVSSTCLFHAVFSVS